MLFRLFSLSLFVLLLLFSSSIYAQETLSGLQRQIERVEKEIAREKKLHKQDKEKALSFETQKNQKMNTLDEQLIKIKKKQQELTAQIQKLKIQKIALQKGILQYQKRRKEVLVAIEKTSGELIKYFQTDFPHQREKKVKDLQKFQKEIQKGGLSTEEALNRFFSFLSQIIDQGYESEVFSGTYTSNKGVLYDGHYLRLGAAVYAFASLDGKQVAYLLNDKTSKGYYWEDENLPLNLRQSIKQAIQVAQGKSAPELVTLPISISQKNLNSKQIKEVSP